MLFFGVDIEQIKPIESLISTHELPIQLDFIKLSKLNNKHLNFAFCDHHANQAFIVEKDRLLLIQKLGDDIIKVSPDWASQTRRVVSAGRKSELVLQACKLTAGMMAIDGTAGFGHDSLILASTGASVLMLESSPIMALMLYAEYAYMQDNQNWQGLLSRLSIRYGDVRDCTDGADVVYLDPMFPKDSYDAKVNKHMQALHSFVAPPSLDDENDLLSHAKSLLRSADGRVVVKRPLNAPFLANEPPIQSWQNDAIRFDRYDGQMP